MYTKSYYLYIRFGINVIAFYIYTNNIYIYWTECVDFV